MPKGSGLEPLPFFGRLQMSGEVSFSARAVRRLRIAAALLRLQVDEGAACAQQCQRVLNHIERLDAQRRQRLRDQVDWVEAYERAEEGEPAAASRIRTGPVHKAVDRQWLHAVKPRCVTGRACDARP